jgi:hypothetical protein
MKKVALFLTVAILLPAITMAIPATPESHTTPSPINYESLQNYLRTRSFLHKRFTNGLRKDEFKPYVYTQKRLQNKNVGVHQKPVFPGIEYKKLCYHWKNCVKRVYKASDSYDRAYQKYQGDTKIINNKLDEAFVKNDGRRFHSKNNRSGKYKLFRWSFLRNRR